MACKNVFGIYHGFGKRNPMIYSLFGGYAVLAVEKRINQTIGLKFRIFLPAIFRI